VKFINCDFFWQKVLKDAFSLRALTRLTRVTPRNARHDARSENAP